MLSPRCVKGIHVPDVSDPWYETHSNRCRACKADSDKKWVQANKDKVKANQKAYRARYPNRDKEWREKNPEKWKIMQRRKALKRCYGISIEQYEEMLERQNGVCAVCFGKCRTGRRLSVDHDHETGEVRGLLCSKCNFGIGLLESPEKLVAAQKYLSPRDRWATPES